VEVVTRIGPVAAATLAIATAATTSTAEPTASKTLDRTFSCSVLARAGARIVEVSARSGTRDAGNRRWWTYNPAVEIQDRNAPFASFAAGAPSAEHGARPAPPPAEGFFPVVERWLALDPRLCATTTAASRSPYAVSRAERRARFRASSTSARTRTSARRTAASSCGSVQCSTGRRRCGSRCAPGAER
jgi:hypothetical protein